MTKSSPLFTPQFAQSNTHPQVPLNTMTKSSLWTTPCPLEGTILHNYASWLYLSRCVIAPLCSIYVYIHDISCNPWKTKWEMSYGRLCSVYMYLYIYDIYVYIYIRYIMYPMKNELEWYYGGVEARMEKIISAFRKGHTLGLPLTSRFHTAVIFMGL